AQLAPELHFSRQLVDKPDRSCVALVLPIEAHVLVEAPADLQRTQQPAAERVVNFDADVAPEQAGDARYRGFVRGRGRRELNAGEAGRGPDQRRIGDEPAQVGKLRILVGAREIADRNFAGELAGDLESRAYLWGDAVGIAVEAEPIGREVVDALIDTEFDERLEAGRDLVAGACLQAVLIVVAILVAERGAVGEQRIGIIVSVDGALERDVEPIEALIDRRSPSELGVDWKLGDTGREVGTAGIFRRQDVARL